MTYPTANDVAYAVIIAARHEKVDACKTITKGSRARYMALRLLMRAFPSAVKARLSRYVGYSGHVSNVVAAPSYAKHLKFDKEAFDNLFSEYQNKLQNRAIIKVPNDFVESKDYVDVSLGEPTEIVDKFDNPAELKPRNSPVVEVPKFLPSRKEQQAKQLDGIDFMSKKFVQVPAPKMSNRKTLEEELKQAVLNTGGRLKDDV